jgi:hypothetical protein
VNPGKATTAYVGVTLPSKVTEATYILNASAR